MDKMRCAKVTYLKFLESCCLPISKRLSSFNTYHIKRNLNLIIKREYHDLYTLLSPLGLPSYVLVFSVSDKCKNIIIPFWWGISWLVKFKTTYSRHDQHCMSEILFLQKKFAFINLEILYFRIQNLNRNLFNI